MQPHRDDAAVIRAEEDVADMRKTARKGEKEEEPHGGFI